MSGYVASARIVSATPRLLRREADEGRLAAATGEADAVLLDVDGVERPGVAARLEERAGRARDRWAQLTFFLTDPNGWR